MVDVNEDQCLSNGEPILVRRLYFLELDEKVPFKDVGPHIHTYIVDGGKEQRVAYGLEHFQVTPEKPKTPYEKATNPETEEYALWARYNLYQAILLHEDGRHQARESHLVEIAKYILSTCISKEDRARVITPDDYEVVYRQALCPEIGEEDIIAVLASTFQGVLEGTIFVEQLGKTTSIRRKLQSIETMGSYVNVTDGIEPTAVR